MLKAMSTLYATRRRFVDHLLVASALCPWRRCV
jgi:hypothetical protein